MKKIFAILFGIVVGIGVIVGACVVLLRDDSDDLEVLVAQNISVMVGEEKQLVTKVNNKGAVLQYSIEDHDVAESKLSGSLLKVLGVSAGSTNLKITATYKDEKVVKDVSVTVVAKEQKDDTNPADDSDGDPIENVDANTKFSLNIENATIDENKITTKEDVLFVEVIIESLYKAYKTEITGDSGLEITDISNGGSVFRIVFLTDDPHTITVAVNNKTVTYSIEKIA